MDYSSPGISSMLQLRTSLSHSIPVLIGITGISNQVIVDIRLQKGTKFQYQWSRASI